MKYSFSIFVAVCLLVLAGACSSAATYHDGTYTATQEEYHDGWRDTVTVEISGGKITDVDWDSLREEDDASKKELSKSGEYNMVAGGAKSQWHEQALSMEKVLVDQQDPAKIKVKANGQPDAVSGVTMKVGTFRELAEDAVNQAR